MSLTKEMCVEMLKLQDVLNATVHPDWRNSGNQYLRAAAVEGVEAIEHHGWKWWKAQKKDLPQLQMELVDIWHFILSDLLIKGHGNVDTVAGYIMSENDHGYTLVFDGEDYDPKSMDTLQKLELMVGLFVARRVNIGLFSSVMKDCEMDWDILFRQYIGKNVLNTFRQDHGYKQGTYIKEWNGREDNEVLTEIVSGDLPDSDVPDYVYKQLREAYAGVGRKASHSL